MQPTRLEPQLGLLQIPEFDPHALWLASLDARLSADVRPFATYLAAMGKLKSERHHWWPECVSRHWEDDEGGVHWLLVDGSERRAKPSAFGVIGNGHFMKLGRTPGDATPWDQNFEDEFQNADSCFPAVIAWLESLLYEARLGQPRRDRFVPQSSSDELFGHLVEGMISLAIRSPMTRSAAVALAERLRGPLPERERNSLITANMRYMHRRAVQAFGVRGKATAILSPDREFIFGDGFYYNLTSPSMAPHSPCILTPITPRLAVLYTIPLQYAVEPRLLTLMVDAEEAAALNEVVQVYACEALFYRSEKPTLTDDFRVGKHLQYTSSHNIVRTIMHDTPGVPSYDTSLEFLDEIVLGR